MNGIFQAEEVYGGSYDLKDFYKVRIGSVENVILKTESLKGQIGEIKDNVIFKDFEITWLGKFSRIKGKGNFQKVNGITHTVGVTRIMHITRSIHITGIGCIIGVPGIPGILGIAEI